MKHLVRLTIGTILLATPSLISGQAAGADAASVRSTAAYAEVLLRKTELLADIDALSADYTEANPRMLDLRFEAGSLDRALEKILAVKPAEAGKLTLALGKLLVRRASLETDLDRLSRNYAKDHPDVKRAKRRVEIFDAAIKEVLK
jgi:uncharacterized protein involved in exopolysaccharide biosynthesis